MLHHSIGEGAIYKSKGHQTEATCISLQQDIVSRKQYSNPLSCQLYIMMALVMIREREGRGQIIANLNHVARNTFEILWSPASIDQNVS